MNRFQYSCTILVVAFAIVLTPSNTFAQNNTSDVAEAARLVTVLQSVAPVFDKAMACRRLAVVGDGESVAAIAPLLADEQLATYARTALEGISDPAASEALRRAMETLEGDLLIGVIDSIGKLRDEQSVDRLGMLMDRQEGAVSTAAARALGNIASPRAAEVLQGSFLGADPEFLQDAAKACLICAQRFEQEDQRDLAIELYDAVRNLDVLVQLQLAATRGAIVARGNKGIPLLVEQLADSEEAQFRHALGIARELGPDASAALAEQFEKSPAERQLLIVHALGDIGGPVALRVATHASRAENMDIRIAALQVLGQLGGAAETLLKATEDSNEQIAKSARVAFAKLEGEDINALIIPMIRSSSVERMAVGIQLASERGIASASPALLELTRHDEVKIRLAATKALGTTIGSDTLPQLIALAIGAEADNERQVAHEALTAACRRLPQDATAEQLSAAMLSATIEAQVALIDHLAAVGGAKALHTVVTAAKGDEDSLQDAATRVLGKWATPDVAPPLLGLAKTMENSKYRIRALRGYLRVARMTQLSSEEQLEICKNALDLAERVEEKRLALETLARVESPAAAALAAKYLEDAGLKDVAAAAIAASERGFVSLFDGQTTAGWEGSKEWFRVEEGAIVAGSLQHAIPRNEFLCTEKELGDFELRLEFKLIGKSANAGVQIRSRRVEGHHEVSGYQADLGDNWWGCLYDESRRNRVLAGPPENERTKPIRRDEWNDYRIRCEGNRIQLWINNTLTVDYTEEDANIEQTGIIGLQVHSGAPMEAWYRNIRVKEL